MAQTLRINNTKIKPLIKHLQTIKHPSTTLHKIKHYLNTNLNNIINILNPKIIILNNIFHTLFPTIHKNTLKTLTTTTLKTPREQIHIIIPQLNNNTILINTTKKTFKNLLTNPTQTLKKTYHNTSTTTTPPKQITTQNKTNIPT